MQSVPLCRRCKGARIGFITSNLGKFDIILAKNPCFCQNSRFQRIISVFWKYLMHAVYAGLHEIFWTSFEVFNWLLAYFKATNRIFIVCFGLNVIFWISFELFNWFLAYFGTNKSHAVCLGLPPSREARGRGGAPLLRQYYCFLMRGICEVLTEHHERPSQEEKNEKRYFAFPMIKNPKQRHLQRPRGTSRVFIDFHWLSLISIGFDDFRWFSLIFDDLCRLLRSTRRLARLKGPQPHM